MTNLTFSDELEKLLELVEYKQFIRIGQVLYAEYCGALKAECTVSELVWGWCRNPCFANTLIGELILNVPDYSRILGNGNRSICSGVPANSFVAWACRRQS